MKGVPWMVSAYCDEASLTDPDRWAGLRRRAAQAGQTLLAAPVPAGELPRRATFFDDDVSQIFSAYDGRIPIADQHVRTHRESDRERQAEGEGV
jgi:hypothetical protein